MDDAQVGSVFRAVRIRRGLRQSDVADKAGISRALLSELESGQLEQTCLATVRRVAAALGISVKLAPRWRGPDLAVLLDEMHARLVGVMTQRLAKLGWIVRPEHTFAVFGENGSIDVFAWFPTLRAILVIEVKTVIVDLQDTLAAMDRKRRLALRLARELRWDPVCVGSILVLPSTTRSRGAIGRHQSILAAALPARGQEVQAWLRRPNADLRGILLIGFPNISPGDAKCPRTVVSRVRVQSKPPAHAQAGDQRAPSRTDGPTDAT